LFVNAALFTLDAMATMMLTEPAISPTPEVLKAALGNSYIAYEKLMETVTSNALQPQWNYYKDGKAWLCKIQRKKKTVFWLSVWENCFKTTFYFTAKSSKGINALEIDDKIKIDFAGHKSIGKLLPLIFTIHTKQQLTDLLKVIDFKTSLL
jgi:hypothetical protein